MSFSIQQKSTLLITVSGPNNCVSKTILKGLPSSFTLELPPYRKPQIGRIITRSVFDRTLFVLGRAVAVAAPAGLVIWLMANITIGDTSLLTYAAGFLDPFGRLLGMDGSKHKLQDYPFNKPVHPAVGSTVTILATVSLLSRMNRIAPRPPQ